MFCSSRNDRAGVLDPRHGGGAEFRPQLHRREGPRDAPERPEDRARQHTATADHCQPRPRQTGEVTLHIPRTVHPPLTSVAIQPSPPAPLINLPNTIPPSPPHTHTHTLKDAARDSGKRLFIFELNSHQITPLPSELLR